MCDHKSVMTHRLRTTELSHEKDFHSSGFRWLLYYLTMNGIAHAVLQLGREFGKYINIKNTCYGYTPDSNNLYNILNGLFHGHSPSALQAGNWVHMSLTFKALPLFLFSVILEPKPEN